MLPSMEIEEAKRAWLVKLVQEKSKGNAAAFGREIGKDSSYVSRMLRPVGHKDRKGLGEDTIKAIIERWPDAGMPEGMKIYTVDSPPPTMARLFTKERRADDDVMALRIAVESLAVALLQRSQRGAATAFLADLDALTKRKGFSIEHRLLGRLAGIARQVQSHEAAEAQVQSRARPARRTKP